MNKRIVIVFIAIVIVVLTIVILTDKTDSRAKLTMTTQKWIPFKSNELEFSALIPDTWLVVQYPEKKILLFRANLYRYTTGSEEKEIAYMIYVKRMSLDKDKTLEDFFFPKEQYAEEREKLFVKEKKGDNFIYTSKLLNTQQNKFVIFVSQDEKNFIRYSLTSDSKENNLQAQEQTIQELNTVTSSTKLF